MQRESDQRNGKGRAHHNRTEAQQHTKKGPATYGFILGDLVRRARIIGFVHCPMSCDFS